jgi:hypothetical protein
MRRRARLIEQRREVHEFIVVWQGSGSDKDADALGDMWKSAVEELRSSILPRDDESTMVCHITRLHFAGPIENVFCC